MAARDGEATNHAASGSPLPIGAAAVAPLAPARARQHDGQVWPQVNTDVPLADEVRVTLEQIARGSDYQFHFARGGARARIDHAPNLQLTINRRVHDAPRVND